MGYVTNGTPKNSLAKSLLLAMVLFSTASFGQVNAGIQPLSAYDSHTVDTINLQNLNIVLNVPVKEKSGLMPFSFGFSENSYLFKNGTAWALKAPTMQGTANGSLGVAPGISLQSGGGNLFGKCPDGVTSTVIFTNWSVVLADGSSHPLPSSDSVDYSFHSSGYSCINSTFTDVTTDGSGLTAVISVAGPGASVIQGTVYSPSGMAINGVMFTSAKLSPLAVTDSSGNTVSITSTAATSFTDSLGLTALTASYATTGNSFSWTDVNGGTQQVTTTNTNTTLFSSFGCSGVTEISGSQYLPTKVAYPNGTNLGLSYTAEGRIHVLTLPTGGTVTYSYSGGNNGIDCTYQIPPTLKRVTSDGTTTYTWAAVNNGSGNTTTVVDNGGNSTVYTFSARVLTQVQRYQGSISPSNLLTTDLYCYGGTQTCNFNPSSGPTRKRRLRLRRLGPDVLLRPVQQSNESSHFRQDGHLLQSRIQLGQQSLCVGIRGSLRL